MDITNFPRLSDLPYYEYKSLVELRRGSKLNQRLHQAYIDHINNYNSECGSYTNERSIRNKEAEVEINLAYWLCVDILEDDEEGFDAWVYEEKVKEVIPSDVGLVLAFMRILLDGFINYSEYFIQYPNPLNASQFVDDIMAYITDESAHWIAEHFKKDDYKDCFTKLDFRRNPTPPEKIEMDYNEISRHTNNFEQEDIRKIVFAYKTTEHRLAMLNKIREAFHEYEINDLPF